MLISPLLNYQQRGDFHVIYNGSKTEHLSFKTFTILLENDINYYNNT